jgi:hypothetical protein
MCGRACSVTMRCWIDAQGYCSGNTNFIPKEVAIVTESGSHNFLVKPSKQLGEHTPFERKLINWATRSYHRIPYLSGDVPESDLATKIAESTSDCTEIYTKGRDKQSWLSSFLKTPVVDLHTLGCPSLAKSKLEAACGHHLSSEARCATSGALFLQTWFNGNADRVSRTSSTRSEDGDPTHVRCVSDKQIAEEDQETGSACD